jgi:cell division protein FtsQ
LNFKKNIIRITLLALWIVLGASVLVLLAAAINIKSNKSCKGIEIEIQGVKEIFFLDKADILKIVSGESVSEARGKPITAFNLQKLETILEQNIWVKDAELFFDNNLVLHINILEKEPVARVFTSSGSSFYLDSSGNKMPLNTKMNVKLPVFTGFPAGKKLSGNADSLLSKQVKNLSMYILNDKFWMAQVAQVDITNDGNFEMIPTVGNHIIEFGDGNNWESKFRRLFIFYKQVLSVTGLDKYSRISVQYDKQVVGTKKGLVAKIDSLQALKNIQSMIEEAKKISEDSLYVTATDNIQLKLPAVSQLTVIKADSGNEMRKKTLKSNNANLKAVEVPRKSIVKPAKAIEPKPADQKQKPKAVMNKLINAQ